MKRNKVMDLYWGKIDQDLDGIWHELENEKPESSCLGVKVKVKLSDNSEVFAYYYPTLPSLQFAETHFFHSSSHEPLINITHWKYLKSID